MRHASSYRLFTQNISQSLLLTKCARHSNILRYESTYRVTLETNSLIEKIKEQPTDTTLCVMSGVGNNVGGSTIFTSNTVQGGVNDVTVNNEVVEGDLTVLGNTNLYINTINNDLFVNGNLQVGDPTIGAPPKTLNVTGTTQIGGGLAVTGISSFNNDVTIGVDANIAGDINVGENTDLPALKRARFTHSTGTVDFGMNASGNAVITTDATKQLIVNSRLPYANVIYVATTGNDTTGTGSQTNPYLTITKALTIGMPLYADLCVHVAAGTYTEDLTIPDHACSVTIIGASFPSPDYEGFIDQFSTVLTGSFRLTSGSSDSQVSLKYLRYNFATNKNLNATVTSARGPFFIDSCYFTRQDVDEAQVLAIFDSSITTYIRNSSFSKPGTVDSTGHLISSNGTVFYEKCSFTGRVVSNGVVNVRGTTTFDLCTFYNNSTSTSLAGSHIYIDGSLTGRSFRCLNTLFYSNRSAILINTNFLFANCSYSLFNTKSTGNAYMFMNTGGIVCNIQLLNVSQQSAAGGASVITRATAFDPVNFSVSTLGNSVTQSLYMSDFNIEGVNTVRGSTNTDLTLESLGTGDITLAANTDINLNAVGSIVVGS